MTDTSRNPLSCAFPPKIVRWELRPSCEVILREKCFRQIVNLHITGINLAERSAGDENTQDSQRGIQRPGAAAVDQGIPRQKDGGELRRVFGRYFLVSAGLTYPCCKT